MTTGRKRFKDGRFYRFAELCTRRPGLMVSSGFTLIVRYCPSGSKETGATWRARRRKLRKDALKLIRWKNRVLGYYSPGDRIGIGHDKLPLGDAGIFLSDWLKIAASGVPTKKSREHDRGRLWLSAKHPRHGRPGSRSETQ